MTAERRRAAADLALWLAATATLFGAALALRGVAPTQALILLGEPVEMLVLLAVATALLRREGLRWRDLGLTRPASGWRTLGLVAGGWIATYAGGLIVLFGVIRPLGLPSPDVKLMLDLMRTPFAYPVTLLLTWTTVAFGEELQFRGFIFSRFEQLFGGSRRAVLGAWLAQGLLFGALHAYQGPGGMMTTGTIGLVLGGVYLLGRRNLAACVIVHGLIDTAGLTAMVYVAHHGGVGL